jgi:ribosome-associated protein
LSAQAISKPKLSTEQLNNLIVDSIQDIKGKNIVKLDLRRIEEAPADFFIICEGDSSTQVKAISDRIYKRVKDETGTTPNHTEGESQAMWICVDYFNTVVHIFFNEKRRFYELELLWSDAKFTEYDNL